MSKTIMTDKQLQELHDDIRDGVSMIVETEHYHELQATLEERAKDEIHALIEKYGNPQYKTSEFALYDLISVAQHLEAENKRLKKRNERLADTAEREIKKNKRLKERYKDYERLWEIADHDDCDGSCDEFPPHKKCPRCSAGHLINELGEIRSDGLREIEQAIEGEGNE